jgi:hypothetical protein
MVLSSLEDEVEGLNIYKLQFAMIGYFEYAFIMTYLMTYLFDY